MPSAPPMRPKTDWMPIAAIIASVLTCGILALPALVLSIISLARINRSQGRLTGQAVAIVGIVLSAIMLISIPIPVAILYPVFAKAREKARAVACLSNVKQLNLGLMMYADDWDGYLPPAQTWADGILPYLRPGTSPEEEALFDCPASGAYYALNEALAGQSLDALPDNAGEVVLVFDSDIETWNAHGTMDALPATPPHGQLYTIGFADGHVESQEGQLAKSFIWEPAFQPVEPDSQGY